MMRHGFISMITRPATGHIFRLCLALICGLVCAFPDGVSAQAKEWRVEEKRDRWLFQWGEVEVASFVFDDPKILRPYFCNLKTLDGVQVTRNHPPVAGVDADDHSDMHPGLWLGFGDVSGEDFWRNRGKMQHQSIERLELGEKLVGHSEPFGFVQHCQWIRHDGSLMARQQNRIELSEREGCWQVVWRTKVTAGVDRIVFGDQEEMGLGCRVATAITEKNGGRIRNSDGFETAKETWGKEADWCDYVGELEGRSTGVLLIASSKNFRRSWWHNRDYGVFVANPFGRQAMTGGEKSEVVVEPGESLELEFAAVIHRVEDFQPTKFEPFR